MLRANCFAIIAYAQLIAQNAVLMNVPRQIVSAIFEQLVLDLGACGVTIEPRMCVAPRTGRGDWDFITQRIASDARAAGGE